LVLIRIWSWSWRVIFRVCLNFTVRVLERRVLTIVIGKFFTHNADQAIESYTTHKTPHVTNIPTLTGGIGADELKRFYSEYFTNPPLMKITLLSRTIGTDLVVDEMHIRFKHTQEMPWILPGVPPTDKKVEILVVSIVALKEGSCIMSMYTGTKLAFSSRSACWIPSWCPRVQRIMVLRSCLWLGDEL
jgi:hypothetical protein